MLKRNILQLLIIATLLSGCVFIEKNLDKAPVSEIKNIDNVEPLVRSSATSTKENKTEESNFPKENWIPIEKINLTIDFGKEKKTAQVEFKDEMTVYDVLEQGTEDLEIILETQMYSVGVFINVVGDKKNGQDNNYWTYYVNDKFANVAADKYILKVGDRVEWKFSKL